MSKRTSCTWVKTVHEVNYGHFQVAQYLPVKATPAYRRLKEGVQKDAAL